MAFEIRIYHGGDYRIAGSLGEILRHVGGVDAEVFFDKSDAAESVNQLLCGYKDMIVQNSTRNPEVDFFVRRSQYVTTYPNYLDHWITIYSIFWDNATKTWI